MRLNDSKIFSGLSSASQRYRVVSSLHFYVQVVRVNDIKVPLRLFEQYESTIPSYLYVHFYA